MYPLIRVDKRIPNGTIWQARRGYLLAPNDGWTRVYGPAGTEWSNPLGAWKTETAGISIFHQGHPFTISCHGPERDKRFYIDIAYRVHLEPQLIEFTDLFLDVMIGPQRVVTEKDEHQLTVLPHALQSFARAARDDVLRRITSGDPLFDATSEYYEAPHEVLALPAAVGTLVLG
ncbi:MAG TPA: DUF402 domain-containing protein [Candidatus Limnocylindria bacterium]|jgi:hypothetical protein